MPSPYKRPAPRARKTVDIDIEQLRHSMGLDRRGFTRLFGISDTRLEILREGVTPEDSEYRILAIAKDDPLFMRRCLTRALQEGPISASR